jgi:hypothetical protein
MPVAEIEPCYGAGLVYFWLVPGLMGGADAGDLPARAGQPDLLRARRRDRLPIHRAVHHLAHALKPPLRPAQPALAPDAPARVSETQFHLSIEHNCPFFCARSYEGHMDKYCPGRKNVLMDLDEMDLFDGWQGKGRKGRRRRKGRRGPVNQTRRPSPEHLAVCHRPNSEFRPGQGSNLAMRTAGRHRLRSNPNLNAETRRSQSHVVCHNHRDTQAGFGGIESGERASWRRASRRRPYSM